MMIPIMIITKNNDLRDGCGAARAISKDHLCLKNPTPAGSASEAQRGHCRTGLGTSMGATGDTRKQAWMKEDTFGVCSTRC